MVRLDVMGKRRGTDIVDNKKTFLMIQALEKASPDEREVLTSWLTRRKFDPDEKIKAVTDIFDRLENQKTYRKQDQRFLSGGTGKP